MDNFDYKKYLKEGKLREVLSINPDGELDGRFEDDNSLNVSLNIDFDSIVNAAERAGYDSNELKGISMKALSRDISNSMKGEILEDVLVSLFQTGNFDVYLT